MFGKSVTSAKKVKSALLTIKEYASFPNFIYWILLGLVLGITITASINPQIEEFSIAFMFLKNTLLFWSIYAVFNIAIELLLNLYCIIKKKTVKN